MIESVTFNHTVMSRFCLGTVQLGVPYGVANTHGQPSTLESYSILNSALINGINCFDTAQGYGASESILGGYHKNFPSSTMHIITKISSEQFSIGAKAIIANSLFKLNTKTLFGLLLHDSTLLSQWSKKESSIVNDLKSEKILQYFGLSIYSDEEFFLALQNPDIDIIQIPYNLFDRRAFENNWFDKAKKANKLLFIRSVFLQGLFFISGNALPEKLQQASPFLTKLQSLTHTYNCSIPALALSFVKSSAPDSIIIIGCETNEQLLKNISLFNSSRILDDVSLQNISDQIGPVPAHIYNPALWER